MADKILIDFIAALRKSELMVSPAETIDAFSVVALVGYDHRSRLKSALLSVLAKNYSEKEIFDQCFDQFFSRKSELSISNKDELADEQVLIAQNQFEKSTPVNELNRAAEASPDVVSELLASKGVETDDNLLSALLSSDRVALEMMAVSASQQVELSQISYFTQRNIYTQRMLQAMGVDTVNEAIGILEHEQLTDEANNLRMLSGRLRDYVSDIVDDQLLLNANEAGRELRTDILMSAKLSSVERQHFDAMQALVRKMAKQLMARHARRQLVQKRGQLDIGKTLRSNIANQGVLFNTHWKKRKKERPDVFAICDVSGSVSAYAKFLLLFLYSLSEVIPKTRSFAFSSDLGEVTPLFQQLPIEQAIEKVNHQWGMGSTNYGQAFEDFSELALDDIRSNSTVIIIGDARNNYGDPKLKLLKKIYQRCGMLVWLNPESQYNWRAGDSEMMRYKSCAHLVATCRNLRELENIMSRIIRLSN